MHIESVEIKNFLSIADAKVEFPKAGLILVSGWNETLGRANGAGKSALMQAVCWCLYDELPRNIKVDEIVRRGQQGCSVTVSLTVDGTNYVATRKRPTGFELAIDGVKQKGAPKQLSSQLQMAVGFNYEQFLITSYFPQSGDSSRFLKQKDAVAKTFLGSILNFSKADSASSFLFSQLKEAEMEASKLSSSIKELNNSLSKLKSLQGSPIPELPSKEEVHAVKSELSIVEVQANNPPDTSDIDSRISLARNKKSAVDKLRIEISKTESKIREAKSELSRVESASTVHYMECPSCSEKLVQSGEELLVHDEDSVQQVLASNKEAITSKLSSLEQKLSAYMDIFNREKGADLKLEELISEKASFLKDHQMASQRVNSLKSQLQSYKRMYEAHKAAKDQALAIQEQIKDTEERLESQSQAIKVYENQILEIVAARSVLSPTGAIAYALDSVISDVNEAVTAYLDIFSHGTMSYRMSSGEDKAKIVHHITYGDSEVSIGSLSGGEERGLILSVDMGLSEVLAKRCGKPLPSLLMLDECFEGLDYIGKEKVLDALKEIAANRCIIVVDHSTEMSAMFDETIKVVKRGDVSYVERV